jgi:hypothetical protein
VGADEADPLAVLVGVPLATVEFGDGWYALHLRDGEQKSCVLRVFNPSRVVLPGAEYGAGETGFRDALCDLIGHRVRGWQVRHKVSMRVERDGGAAIAVTLEAQDFEGDKAA